MKFLAHGILTNNNLNNRDLRLDFWRGIGCIGVIALHTAYYSGDGYTPVWFKSMLMVVDVPLFFFCSGWGSNYGTRNVFKVFKSIGMIWLKWIFFVSILAVIRLFLSQNWIGFDSLFSAYLFKASSKYFPVLSDSIWFMPYYFAVVFVNSFVTILLKSNDEYKKLYCIFLIVVYLGLVYDYNFFNLNITFIFYSFFWILGNILYKKRISGRSLILGVIVLLFGYFFWGNYIQHIAIDNLQANKFPPQPLYLIASLFIILCILYYRRGGGYWCLITHIGENAIFYFMGQGIGSAIMYYIVPFFYRVRIWQVKWVISFLINMMLIIFVSEFISFLWSCFMHVCSQRISYKE